VRADLAVRAGGFEVRARLEVGPGDVVAVVGPNGAGKTTLLRGIAGLRPASGSLHVAGRSLAGVPPERRRVGWVPQGATLFPHLSALDNVGYGLRVRGVRRSAARRTAQTVLDRLGIGALATRTPAQLSGGQAARVALARALAPDPAVLLLDEPLAALDAEIRDDIRRLLRATLAGGAVRTLLVTHDPVDAVALADRIVVLEAGRVVQDGPAADVAAAPRSAWAAGMLGQNGWTGTSDATGLVCDGGGHVAAAEPLPPGTRAIAVAAPSSVALHRRPPEGSPRTVLHGDVASTTSLGGRVRVRVDSTPAVLAEVTPAAAAELRLADGGPVWASLKASEVRLVAM
jgi:ABC-type sulfate/molybdate transport systems ATPase subunit